MIWSPSKRVWIIRLVFCANFLAGGCQKSPPVRTDLPWQKPEEQLKLLDDSDFRVRALAAYNLGNMGAQAAGAVPRLEALKNDPNLKVQKAVELALQKIGGTTIPVESPSM